MRALLIANPAAGRGRAGAAAEIAARELAAAGWQAEVAHTTAPGQAVTLAAQAEHDVLVIACGGDGTLSEVVNGRQGTASPVGTIPSGTGNDFARALGMSSDPAEAAQQLLHGRPLPVDALRLQPSRLLAINILGVGFDATVAGRMNRQTRCCGGACAYVTAVLMELVRLPRVKVTLRLDDEVIEREALLVAIANAPSYGGGMRIAPRAELSDGLADVVLVEPMSRLSFLRAFPRVFRGTHLDLPQVRTWQVREVSVETTEPSPVLLDGDLREQTPLHVSVERGGALLWVPA